MGCHREQTQAFRCFDRFTFRRFVEDELRSPKGKLQPPVVPPLPGKFLPRKLEQIS